MTANGPAPRRTAPRAQAPSVERIRQAKNLRGRERLDHVAAGAERAIVRGSSSAVSITTTGSTSSVSTLSVAHKSRPCGAPGSPLSSSTRSGTAAAISWSACSTCETHTTAFPRQDQAQQLPDLGRIIDDDDREQIFLVRVAMIRACPVHRLNSQNFYICDI